MQVVGVSASLIEYSGAEPERGDLLPKRDPNGVMITSPVMTSLRVAALAVVAMLAVGCDSAATSTPKPSLSLSPSPSSSPSPSGDCTTSAAGGTCGPYEYPKNTASNGYNTYVHNNVWSPISGWQQTLYANNPGDWSVTANMPVGNTAVVSYPGTSQAPSGNDNNPLIGSYSTLTSSFSENMNATSQTDAEAAYDIWTGAGEEIMIQHDFSALRPRCSADAGDPVLATVGFTEPGTSTVQDWDFCKYGSERIWQLHGGNEKSGSVDIGAMLRWLMNHGYLPQGSRLGLVGYGFEICSTGGQNENFQVSSYSLTAIVSGSASPSPS
jgi:hypothetical protein